MDACDGRCNDCPFACHADHENDDEIEGEVLTWPIPRAS